RVAVRSGLRKREARNQGLPPHPRGADRRETLAARKNRAAEDPAEARAAERRQAAHQSPDPQNGARANLLAARAAEDRRRSGRDWLRQEMGRTGFEPVK